MERPRRRTVRAAARTAKENLKMAFEKMETESIEIQKELEVTKNRKIKPKRRPVKIVKMAARKKKSAAGPTNRKMAQKSTQKESQSKNQLAARRVSGKSQSGKAKTRSVAQKAVNTTTKSSPSVNILPHGLGINVVQSAKEQQKTTADSNFEQHEKLSPQTAGFVTPYAAIEPPVIPKRGRKAALVLGVSPFPELPYPTAEQAYEVEQLLAGAHGQVNVPEVIPIPSKDIAGCGEVKFTLEALIRTMISAHTTMGNANMAIEGIAKTYSVFEDGLTAGCIDWNQVLIGGREKLEEAIKRGGMQRTKSRDIIRTLQMVQDENRRLRADILEKTSGTTHESDGATNHDKHATVSIQPAEYAEDDEGNTSAFDVRLVAAEVDSDASTPEMKRANFMSHLAVQALLSKGPLLTLDYVHSWPVDSIFNHLQAFPGVGVKTAACVLLFCMRRPLFAVDTHVFRICKWLGWAPANADRNKVFFHCDVKIPDDLKYKLHQLLIVHGKCCLRCRAAVGDSNPGWKDAVCCLEHLLTRSGPKKLSGIVKGPHKRKKDGSASGDSDETQANTKTRRTKIGTKTKSSTGNSNREQQVSSNGQTKFSAIDTDSSELSDLESSEDSTDTQIDIPNFKRALLAAEQYTSSPTKEESSATANLAKLSRKAALAEEAVGLDDLAKVFGASAAAAMRQHKSKEVDVNYSGL